jgi:L-amino acid N-acyltransferase
MQLISCDYDKHAQAILAIFNEAIINSTALYDYHPRSMATMVEWFAGKQAANQPVIGVCDATGTLAGFASYGSFRPRPAYKYCVEHSLYVHQDFRGQGLGKQLLDAIIKRAIAQDYHTMIGGIDMENAASIALHEKFGFVHTGTIKQAGFKFGRWLDVGFYQLMLPTPSEPRDG